MQRFLFVAMCAFVTAQATPADDTKLTPQDAAALKKQIEDLKSRIVKKETELKKVKEDALVVAAEGLKIRAAGQKTVADLEKTLDKLLDAPLTRAREAKADADKADRAAAVVADTLDDAKEKLKNANDPNEIAELKKKVAQLEAALTAKKALAMKARAEAKATDAELTKAIDAMKVVLKLAVDAADAAKTEAQKNEARANRVVVNVQDELDVARAKLRKAQEQLRASEK